MTHFILSCVIMALAGTMLWLVGAMCYLARCMADTTRAYRLLATYRILLAQSDDAIEAGRRREQTEISRQIYRDVVSAYNLRLKKPQYRIPARLMGCSAILGDEET